MVGIDAPQKTCRASSMRRFGANQIHRREKKDTEVMCPPQVRSAVEQCSSPVAYSIRKDRPDSESAAPDVAQSDPCNHAVHFRIQPRSAPRAQNEFLCALPPKSRVAAMPDPANSSKGDRGLRMADFANYCGRRNAHLPQRSLRVTLGFQEPEPPDPESCKIRRRTLSQRSWGDKIFHRVACSRGS